VSVALLLSLYGIAMVYSAGQTDVPQAFVSGAWKRQLFWFVLALPAAWGSVGRRCASPSGSRGRRTCSGSSS
jgi:cell division protein FtsW (lipid II flippase)